MDWITALVLCAGSLVHNDFYLRGRYGWNLLVAARFRAKVLRELGEGGRIAQGAMFILFVVLAPLGSVYLILASLIHEQNPYRAHVRYLVRGWRDCKRERRWWRYRKQSGKRSRARLNRLREYQENRAKAHQSEE